VALGPPRSFVSCLLSFFYWKRARQSTRLMRDGDAQLGPVARVLEVSQSDIRVGERLVRAFALYSSHQLANHAKSCFGRRIVRFARRVFGKNQKRR